jgi:predicted HD phosphohydrolase
VRSRRPLATKTTQRRRISQSATRAERDGGPVDYVVAGLIHDLGDGQAPYPHGSYAAAALRPFVSQELCGIVSHHPLFQMHSTIPARGRRQRQ